MQSMPYAAYVVEAERRVRWGWIKSPCVGGNVVVHEIPDNGCFVDRNQRMERPRSLPQT